MVKNNNFFFSFKLFINLEFYWCVLAFTYINIPYCFAEEMVFDLSGNEEDVIIYSPKIGDWHAYSLACGDINGDGRDDIVVGIPNADGPKNERSSCGNLYVLYRNKLNQEIDLSEHSDLVIYGANKGECFGYKTALGDINGDEKKDLVVASEYGSGPEDDPRFWCGKIQIFFGADNLPLNWDLAIRPADVTIYGADSEDQAGTSLDLGDINGDGKDDIIIGAPFAKGPSNGREDGGEVYVIYGSNNLPSVWDLKKIPPDVLIYNKDEDDYMGYAVAGGDINRDGFCDLLIGAPRGDGPNNEIARILSGEVYIIYGNKNMSSVWDLNTSSPAITIYGANKYDWLGKFLASGDINGDGWDDFILGSSGARGEVYVFFGGSNISSVYDLAATNSEIIIYGGGLSANMVSGDVNGDCIDDIIIGAPYANGPENSREYCGEIFAIYGGNNIDRVLDLNSGVADIRGYGTTYEYKIGRALSAGKDVNGDGIGDIIFDGSFVSGEVYIIYGWRPLDLPRINIDTGKDSTDNVEVTVTLSVGGNPTEMLISGDIADSIKNTWIPYTTSKKTSLTGSEGTKTITAKFRNALGRESSEASDSIQLDVSSNNITTMDNYFNPCKGEKAVFRYSNVRRNNVKIEVYNLAGELVRKLLDEERPEEIRTIEWNGYNDYGRIAASGIYFLVIKAEKFKDIKKIFVVE